MTLRQRVDVLEAMQATRIRRIETLKTALDAVAEAKALEIENLKAQLAYELPTLRLAQ